MGIVVISGDGGGDATLRNEIAPSVRGAATRELLVQIELRRILERLARGHVACLIIKGTALAYTVYGSAWHRPRIDTDLLVDPNSRKRRCVFWNPAAPLE